MLAPKAGSVPPIQTQKNPSTKQEGLDSWLGREPRLHSDLHLLPLVSRQLLEIKTRKGLLGQVSNSGLLATKKILSSWENRMEYGDAGG